MCFDNCLGCVRSKLIMHYSGDHLIKNCLGVKERTPVALNLSAIYMARGQSCVYKTI